MMLAVENRNNQDTRTMGEIFFLCFDELQDIQFSEVLKIILDILQDTLQELLFLEKDQIAIFMDAFIQKLPKYILKNINRQKAS